MATATGRHVTEAHRVAQLRLGARTVQRMIDVWPTLDLNNLDATAPRWLRNTLPIIAASRAASVQLATNYVTLFRQIETGSGDVPIVTPAPLNTQAASVSLMVTGPVHVKAAIGRGETDEIASDLGQAGSAASAMRYVLDAGRELITATATADPQAQGWERVASPTACDFCQSIVDEGGVFGPGADFPAHDACGCTAEPVYGA